MGLLDLVGKVRIDGSGVAPGLNQAKGAVSKFTSDIKSMIAGAFGGAAIVSAVKRTIDNIDQLSDASSELGIDVEPLQALKNAAIEASDSFEGLLKVLEKIEGIQLDVINGGSNNGLYARQLFAQKGYSVQDINTMSSDKFAQIMAKEFSREQVRRIFGNVQGANKFEMYRDSLSNIDALTNQGVNNHSILTKSEMEEINKAAATMKSVWNYMLTRLTVLVAYISTVLNRIHDAGAAVVKPVASAAEDLRKKNLEAAEALWNKYAEWSSKVPWAGKYMAEGFHWMRDIQKKYNTPKNAKYGGTNQEPLVSNLSTPIYSDSLLSTGNFLGQSLNNMSIATSLLDESKKTNEILKDIRKNTDKGPITMGGSYFDSSDKLFMF